MTIDKSIGYAEKTWNPFTGCDKVSAGCDNCFALKMAWRHACNPKIKKHYPAHVAVDQVDDDPPKWTGCIVNHFDRFDAPLHWKKSRTIFVQIMGDLFHKNVEHHYLDTIMAVFWAAPQHTYIITTKRPENALRYFNSRKGTDNIEHEIDRLNKWEGPAHEDTDTLPPNVIFNVSVENQKAADKRIPILLQIPAITRGISVEPMLGPADVRRFLGVNGINWVICGAERIGANFGRECRAEWVIDLYEQCRDHGVPFYAKHLPDTVPGAIIDTEEKP